MDKEKLTKRERYEARKMEKEELKKQKERRAAVKKTALWTTGALAAALVLLWIFSAFGGGDFGSDKAPAVGNIQAGERIKGNGTLEIIEYSDFECPACATYYPIVKQIMSEYEDKIVFAYRHFPLSQHKNAVPSAMAAEAAGEQGKFWEMHDFLFENQKEWEKKSNPAVFFEKYAERASLDVEKWKEDFKFEKAKKKINADYTGGLKIGVNATPTFFLNGVKVQPRTLEEFKDLIDFNLSLESDE